MLPNSYLVGKATRMERGVVGLLENMFWDREMDKEYVTMAVEQDQELKGVIIIYVELEGEVERHQEVKVVFVMARGMELVVMVSLTEMIQSLESLRLLMNLEILDLEFPLKVQILNQVKSRSRCTSLRSEGLFLMD